MKARKTWIAKCPCCDSEFICTHKRGSIKKYCSRKCKKRSSKKRYYKKYRERESLKGKRKTFIRRFIKELIKKGVEVIVLVVEWNEIGEAKFIRCDLPVNL